MPTFAKNRDEANNASFPLDFTVRHVPPIFTRGIAPFFVLLWSTGFIVARYGMPYSEPATFTTLRCIAVVVIMLPWLLLARVRWPDTRGCVHIAVVGVLMQAAYLGGVWGAVKLGMGAGLVALVVGLQPLLTAVAAPLVGERTGWRHWVGLGIGFVGVTLVVWDRLHVTGVDGQAMALVVMALLAITAGTLYQKRLCPPFDLRCGLFLQFAGALLAIGPFALFAETRQVTWSASMAGALAWSVFALSIGAASLLMILLRRGDATKVASLMYLTPATTAVLAWLLFDEPLTPLMMAGMAVTALGVASVAGRRKGAPAAKA